jgi:ribosomal protein L11 methyltransferase
VAAPRWTEVLVEVPDGWCELVADELTRLLGTSVAYGPTSLATPPPAAGHEHLRAYALEEGDTPDWRRHLCERLASLAERCGAPELADLAPRFSALPHEDWATSWRKRWKPFRVGRLCVVSPEWTGAVRPGDTRLELEPGGAFGTGRHATTRLCLAALQARLAPGERVLDAGCGTAILAVASLLLGARGALAFDNDRHALPYARDLAERNGVAGRCELRCSELGELEPELGELEPEPGEPDLEPASFDGLVANIYHDVFRDHAAALARWLKPGGWFVFSGILAERAAETSDALFRAGLRVEERAQRGRWCGLYGTRVQ